MFLIKILRSGLPVVMVSVVALCGWTLITPHAPYAHEPEGVVLTVTDARKGKPVKAAKVALLIRPTDRAADAELSRRLREENIEKLLFKSGKKLKTDKAGKVKLPDIGGPALIGVRKGRLWGLVRLTEAPTDSLELSLEPELQLKVQVVGARGKGVKGVPLQLRYGTGQGITVTHVRKTAGRGTARFRHLETSGHPGDEQ